VLDFFNQLFYFFFTRIYILPEGEIIFDG